MKLLFLSLLMNGMMAFCSEESRPTRSLFASISRSIFGRNARSIENNISSVAIKKGPKYIEGLSPESNAWLDQQDRNIGFLLATANNDIDAMRNFITEGANIDYQTPGSQMTALHMVTIGTGSFEVLSLLIQCNARQDLKDAKGFTAGDYFKQKYGH